MGASKLELSELMRYKAKINISEINFAYDISFVTIDVLEIIFSNILLIFGNQGDFDSVWSGEDGLTFSVNVHFPIIIPDTETETGANIGDWNRYNLEDEINVKNIKI